MSNVDSRGVKRGACLDCSCSSYEQIPEEKRSTCGYCGCVPMKHAAIEDTEITSHEKDSSQNNVVISDESLTFEFNELDDNSYEASITAGPSMEAGTLKKIRNLNKDSKKSTKKSTNPNFQATQHVSIKELMPISFRPDIQEGIDNHYLKASQENAIIRSASLNMKSRSRTTNSDITQMATFLLEAYPVLKGNTSVGNSQLEIETRIRRCLVNSNRAHRNTEKDLALQQCVSDACSGMQIEMQKADKKQNITLLKSYLNCTRATRKTEACDTNAKTILEKYPALKKDILILWEFAKLVNIEVSILKRNWLDALPRICSLFLTDEDISRFSTNAMTLQLLNILPSLLKNKEPTEQMILKVHEQGTLISETVPKANVEPYLIGIGDITHSDINLMCYVDSMPLFSTTASEAVPLLMASYWVFQVNFPKPLKNQLFLISALFFRDKTEQILSKDVTNSRKVKHLLKEAKI